MQSLVSTLETVSITPSHHTIRDGYIYIYEKGVLTLGRTCKVIPTLWYKEGGGGGLMSF